jgi:hypothetical protein
MVAHCTLCLVRVSPIECNEESGMFSQRILGHPSVKRQPEDVKVDMEMFQGITNYVVTGNRQYLVMKIGVQSCEFRVVQPLLTGAKLRHPDRNFAQTP